MKVNKPFEIPYEGNEFTRAARCKIDYDISELKHRIQSLRTKRNELSPIYVIPFEILSKIFVLVRDLSGPLPSSETDCHHAPWIRIGHVCRHWQQVALNCPNLWSVPVFTRPSLAEEMMRRSKMMPLIIESTQKVLRTAQMLQQLGGALAQIHRVQSIKLTLCETAKELEAIYSSLPIPHAPLLKNLSVELGNIHRNQFSFPPNALSASPCLQSVEFRFLEFSWNSAIFKHRNLTSLRLQNTSVEGTSTLSTVGQMMDALHQLPNLRTLELVDAIPSHMTGLGGEKTVEFKFLEQLVLIGKAPDCTYVLRHVRYPSHTTVRFLSSYATDIEDSIIDSITDISLLGQNFTPTRNTEIGVPHCPRTVVIRSAQLAFDGSVCGITFFSTTDSVEGQHIPFGDSDPIFQALLHSVAFYYRHLHLLTSIYNSFDLSSLECLVLDWRFTPDHIRTIQDTFGRLPRLGTIRVLRSLLIVCPALQNSHYAPLGTAPHPPSSVTCFPALKTLIIEDVDFERFKIMQNLVIPLAFRTLPDINMPVDSLVFKNCIGVQTEHKGKLGQLVVSLEVNGKVVDVERLRSNDQGDRSDSGDEDEASDFEEEDHNNEYGDGCGSSGGEDYSDEGGFGNGDEDDNE